MTELPLEADTIKTNPADVMVPMRDGVRLHTRVWLPEGDGPFPTVLTRAYHPGFGRDFERFTAAGYAYVGQSTRGHAKSEGAEGVDKRFFHDADDGYDTLDWVVAQGWSNGDVAMYGKSYWGMTQWLVAPLQHPHLKAIVPQNMNPDPWERGYRDHGALQLAHTARRIYDAGDREKVEVFGFDRWYRHLPLTELDTVAGTEPNTLWQDYLRHATYDDFWHALGTRHKIDHIRIPVYLMAGWYDNYPGATFRYFDLLRQVGATDEIRIVVSPSDHLNRVVETRDFGEDAAKDEVALAIRWLDHVVRGIDTGIEHERPVRFFTMGSNTWQSSDAWPPAGTEFVRYHLRGDGSGEVGELRPQAPADETPTTFRYDPEDPVPSIGGNHSAPFEAGAFDQRPNEARPDVLVYSTPPLAESLEVTGPIAVHLWASTTALDTDFVARLIDVHPDGTAYNLTEGILRGRFHRSIWEPPELLEPGRVYEFVVELQPSSNVFLAGHRIRLQVTSSGFPMWDRNPNTGAEQGTDTVTRPCEQTIYHDASHASHVLLPVRRPGS